MAKSDGNVPARVEALVKPAIEALGLRLWDVRYEKEGGEWFLRVLIDRDEPMDTDTCEAASRAIDPILDEADPIATSYYLEVGSPGLGRKLLKPAHFAAMRGQAVAVKLYSPDEKGRKEYRATLDGYTDGVLALSTEDGPEELAFKQAAWVRLCDDDNLF